MSGRDTKRRRVQQDEAPEMFGVKYMRISEADVATKDAEGMLEAMKAVAEDAKKRALEGHEREVGPKMAPHLRRVLEDAKSIVECGSGLDDGRGALTMAQEVKSALERISEERMHIEKLGTKRRVALPLIEMSRHKTEWPHRASDPMLSSTTFYDAIMAGASLADSLDDFCVRPVSAVSLVSVRLSACNHGTWRSTFRYCSDSVTAGSEAEFESMHLMCIAGRECNTWFEAEDSHNGTAGLCQAKGLGSAMSEDCPEFELDGRMAVLSPDHATAPVPFERLARVRVVIDRESLVKCLRAAHRELCDRIDEALRNPDEHEGVEIGTAGVGGSSPWVHLPDVGKLELPLSEEAFANLMRTPADAVERGDVYVRASVERVPPVGEEGHDELFVRLVRP